MRHACVGLTLLLILGETLAARACEQAKTQEGDAALPDTAQFRVIAYNVMDGFGSDVTRREAVALWLARQKPDVVGFEELNGITEDRLLREAAAWGHAYAIVQKEKGYPTGLTSKTPITDVQRVFDRGFLHGFIRARSAGIVFYVVHLAPHDRSDRLRAAAAILEGIPAEEGKPAIMGAKESMKNGQSVIVMGDFNAFSAEDREHYRTARLLESMLELGRNPKPRTLAEDGGFDYSVMQAFRAAPLVDLVRQHHDDPATIFSFPAPIQDRKFTQEQLEKVRVRIDYAMASPDLAKRCIRADVVNGKEMDRMSDHYPVLIDLRWSPPGEGGE